MQLHTVNCGILLIGVVINIATSKQQASVFERHLLHTEATKQGPTLQLNARKERVQVSFSTFFYCTQNKCLRCSLFHRFLCSQVRLISALLMSSFPVNCITKKKKNVNCVTSVKSQIIWHALYFSFYGHTS